MTFEVSNEKTFECTSVSVECQVQPTVASDLVATLLWDNQEESEEPAITGTLGR